MKHPPIDKDDDSRKQAEFTHGSNVDKEAYDREQRHVRQRRQRQCRTDFGERQSDPVGNGI